MLKLIKNIFLILLTTIASSFHAQTSENIGESSSKETIIRTKLNKDSIIESGGSLAELIAKRNFKRSQKGKGFYKKESQNLFNKNNYESKTNSTLLTTFLPETGLYKTEDARAANLDDLSEITDVKEILSVDYYQGEKKVSTVLVTTSEGKIYDHSKKVYDRLNNSSLENISTVIVKKHKIISSKIKRASGEIEHTLSFSIKQNSNGNELFSFWNVDQYPIGNYQNFQIWGNSIEQVVSIANFIIDTQTSKYGLKSNEQEDVLPNVFVKSGSYSNGVVKLNIVNKTNERFIDFVGNIAETSISDHIQVSSIFELSGEYSEILTIETGVLFDIGFSLKTNSSEQKDALYLADGPWGVDYLDEFATITKFDVNTASKEYSDDFYEVNRNAEVAGEVKGAVNLFRHILPGDQSLDVTEFESVNFMVKNTEGLEIIIMQNEDREWENRIRYTIPLNLEEKEYTISFADFVDGKGESVEITDIKTIVFSVIGDYANFKSFSFSVNALSFSAKGVLSTEKFVNQENTEILNYPNPFTSSTTIVLPNTSESIQIQVFDLLGRVVDAQRINTSSISNKVSYNAPKLNRGIYKYRLLDDNNKMYSGSFMIK
jgi:hypothetical protein